jgi:ribonuclease P protein component
VSVIHLPAPTEVDPPRVAFAVPRKVGTAVVRNRLRRQVRSHLAGRAGADGGLAPGAYLVSLAPGAADSSPTELLVDVDRCLDRLTGARR